MSNTNYVILTVASVDFSYRETMTKLMSEHSKDLIANAGAKGTRFGSIGTGEHAGSLIFIQFYDDLNGYQKAIDFQSTSPIFEEIGRLFPPHHELVFLLFCRGLRRSVVVPYNVPLQFFTITYDLVITKPFLRNHVGLQVFSFLGFQDNQWFTLMLFDIFNNSSVLQDIVRSITVPAPKLIMIF